MRPAELLEQILMIVIILAWAAWFALVGVHGIMVPPPWLHKLMYYGTPVPLLIILVIRLRRYRAALRDAETVAQQRGQVDGPYKLK